MFSKPLHSCCFKYISYSRTRQWEERLTMAPLHHICARESISSMIIRQRLQWLGHMARMDEAFLPKIILFSWLPLIRPACSPHRRWRSVVHHDWYGLAENQPEWIQFVSNAVMESENNQSRVLAYVCQECNRQFRRSGDLARHKCIEERPKPLCDQVWPNSAPNVINGLPLEVDLLCIVASLERLSLRRHLYRCLRTHHQQ